MAPNGVASMWVVSLGRTQRARYWGLSVEFMAKLSGKPCGIILEEDGNLPKHVPLLGSRCEG